MRPIKFRAWCKSNKKMWKSHEKFNKYLLCENSQADISTFFDNDNYILMQYTGFKDKNGKEIYDGDIVSYKHYNPQEDEPKYGLVIWSNSGWTTDNIWKFNFTSNYADPDFENLEVVGNKFDNSELIK